MHSFNELLGNDCVTFLPPEKDHSAIRIRFFLSDYFIEAQNGFLLPIQQKINMRGLLRDYAFLPAIEHNEAALAMAVLAGDREAALFLADKVLETYHST